MDHFSNTMEIDRGSTLVTETETSGDHCQMDQERNSFDHLRVAVVHYWLVNMRGGERVLEEILTLFPQADIYTHVVNRDAISDTIKRHKIQTSFISKLPGARRFYSRYLPLMPRALEELDLSEYDLVISSESGPAKGVITGPNTCHLCYCHSPMRYIWDQYSSYKRELGLISRMAFRVFSHGLRQWDAMNSTRVDGFVANSSFVARRIRKYYARPSTIIHPPVDLQNYQCNTSQRKEYFLFVSELVGYKRADLALDAARELAIPLVVVGSGPEASRLREVAGPTVTFKGRVSDEELASLYRNARALIFPALEDFGIVPLEAMACGTPVIGFAQGGLRDSVVDGVTGVYFRNQDKESLVEAIEKFKTIEFDHAKISRHAQSFSSSRFRNEFSKFVTSELISFEG